ncbi:HD-GYP domain-containing protein [Solirubrobacter ginsenosidimutans]|uniref:HD-GYP domain-containing protein n=1 Tax=Solirubrobacter ginsenosidimutans TaxID=490573 RepID=A0A9X3N818_9ACTN|nr:HD-GYP domain-containing protein [Solirubrobacter ginsenosidimutans]MDA0166568.1 HD-GYP domain-containing protein [Solirubrobacter ginsenosidimutans]
MFTRATALAIGEAVVLVVAIVVAALTSTAADWDPPALTVLLLGLALATDWFAVSHGGQRISGSFLALVLAAALLGPAPATAIGIAAVLFDQARAHNPLPRLIANLAAFATFPLVGGLIIAAADLQPESAAFPLLVFATFLFTNLLNFLMIGGHHAFETRTPLADGFRRIFLPVLPSEILSAVLCALVATFYARTGVEAIALMLFVLLTFQYLLRELLLSRDRAERLAGLQLGVLISMLETLALRDRMTARHSAAVARYARAMAKALGWSREDQDLVHTAGLLHDIGKFAFPDSILLADSRLTDEQWLQVKRHPADGARIVRRIDGYAPVAEIVAAHHERWDGRGYPSALAGEAIPPGARLIAVADTYDVITARDSYRKPISTDEAIAELRRSAGGQLDPHVVEVFIGLLTAGDLSFGHGDDADFEAELGFGPRVHAHSLPRSR